MKSLIRYFLAIALSALLLLACSEDENPITPMTEQQATAKALTMTSGTVLSTDTDTTTTGVVYFNVELRTSAGAIIEFEYFLTNGSLKSIQGDQGPFEYEVNPGSGLVLYSKARSAALTARPGVIKRWDLEKNSAGAWVYIFEIDTDIDSYTVVVNAATRVVISS